MSKLALSFLALLLVVAGATTIVLVARSKQPEPDSHAERVIPAEPLENFQLTSQTGEEFDSATLDDEIWIASFFFASCPATCRRQNQEIATLQEAYGEQGVKFVAISVDPAADTPAVLQAYAKGFNAKPNQWYFLTDRSQRIDYTRRVGQDIFKVPVTTQGHADTLILVDRSGTIYDYYNWKKPERMVELRSDIEAMLAGELPAKSDENTDAPESEAAAEGSDVE